MRRRKIASTAASLNSRQLPTLVEEDEDFEHVKDEPAPSPGLETYPLSMYLVPRFEGWQATDLRPKRRIQRVRTDNARATGLNPSWTR